MLTNPLFLSFFAGLVLSLLAATVACIAIHRGYKVTVEPKAAAAPKQPKPETGGVA